MSRLRVQDTQTATKLGSIAGASCYPLLFAVSDGAVFYTTLDDSVMPEGYVANLL
jgi:hypothetical protein